MGQIKNIKLHIVTDIKTYTTHVTNQPINQSECVTLQHTFLQPSVVTKIQQQTTSRQSLRVWELDMMKRASLVVNQCKGRSVADLIAAGSEKMASMPAGGGGGGGGAAAAPSGDAAPAAVEEKKEDKKASSDESGSDDDMGFGLFD